jgi:hypothetical protein
MTHLVSTRAGIRGLLALDLPETLIVAVLTQALRLFYCMAPDKRLYLGLSLLYAMESVLR